MSSKSMNSAASVACCYTSFGQAEDTITLLDRKPHPIFILGGLGIAMLAITIGAEHNVVFAATFGK